MTIREAQHSAVVFRNYENFVFVFCSFVYLYLCLQQTEKKTKRQKDKKTKRQKTKRQKDTMTKRQYYKKTTVPCLVVIHGAVGRIPKKD